MHRVLRITVDGYLARDGSPLAAGDWATDARIAQQVVEAIGASHGG